MSLQCLYFSYTVSFKKYFSAYKLDYGTKRKSSRQTPFDVSSYNQPVTLQQKREILHLAQILKII
jgi:hypothetical protein